MKRLLFLFFLIPISLLAQEYSQVVEVNGINQETLFNRAREWFAEKFNSANNVIQLEDKISGKIIGKGSTVVSEKYQTGGLVNVPVNIEWTPNFTIRISLKDGKYKVELSDIIIRINSPGFSNGHMDKSYTEFLKEKEYYKNGSNPDWLLKNPPPDIKITKQNAKMTSTMYKSQYNLVCKIDSAMNNILKDLNEKMVKQEDNW